jgi:hypothetical protein
MISVLSPSHRVQISRPALADEWIAVAGRIGRLVAVLTLSIGELHAL